MNYDGGELWWIISYDSFRSNVEKKKKKEIWHIDNSVTWQQEIVPNNCNY